MAERNQSPALTVLSEFDGFVTSSVALRAARHSRRTGLPFPRLTNDDVVQWCVEEAVFERLQFLDRPGPSPVTTTEYGVGVEPEPALAAILDQAARWHQENS